MDHTRCARKQTMSASACALVAAFLLVISGGCGVRCDQNLSHAPLPICNTSPQEFCETSNRGAVSVAPSWLVRCRREWALWRHGHGASSSEEAIVIPPPPRFHPVPTRPVFAPLEFEAPAGADIQARPLQDAPVAPKPQMEAPQGVEPGAIRDQTSGDSPSPGEAKASITKQPIAPPSLSEPPPQKEATASAPKLLPRVLTPNTTRNASRPSGLTPPIRSAAKPTSVTSKIPDAPLATEPLAESNSSTDWKPRR